MVTTRSQSRKAPQMLPPKFCSGYKAFYKSIDGYYFGPHETYAVPGEKLVGKRFKFKGKPILCKSAYHYVPGNKGPLEVLKYYPEGRHRELILTEIMDHGTKQDISDDKITSNEIEVIREYTKEETDQLLSEVEDIHYNDGTSLTLFKRRGFLYRDEKEGPAEINKGVNYNFYIYNIVLPTDPSYERFYHSRLNGPSFIKTAEDHLHLKFNKCKWVENCKTHNLKRDDASEVVKEMIAPYHEWDEKKCGEGNCWQWDHNPQRYGLGHTKPPKCMFTQKLPIEYSWDWNESLKDWGIREKDGMFHYYLMQLKAHFNNGEYINLNNGYTYKLEY